VTETARRDNSCQASKSQCLAQTETVIAPTDTLKNAPLKNGNSAFSAASRCASYAHRTGGYIHYNAVASAALHRAIDSGSRTPTYMTFSCMYTYNTTFNTVHHYVMSTAARCLLSPLSPRPRKFKQWMPVADAGMAITEVSWATGQKPLNVTQCVSIVLSNTIFSLQSVLRACP
jgi:hypothetical protein